MIIFSTVVIFHLTVILGNKIADPDYTDKCIIDTCLSLFYIIFSF